MTLLASVLACSEDSTQFGSGSGGEPSAGGSGADGGSGGQAQGGNPAAGGGGEGGQAPSDITPSIAEAALYGNCEPIVGPDPLFGTITIEYLNRGAAEGSLGLTSAVLALTGIDATLTWTFEVDPDSSGAVPAGDTVNVIHTKVQDSGSGNKGDLTPCSYCGAAGTVTVSFADGQTADLPVSAFECAF
jgi:hypothetical protein